MVAFIDLSVNFFFFFILIDISWLLSVAVVVVACLSVLKLCVRVCLYNQIIYVTVNWCLSNTVLVLQPFDFITGGISSLYFLHLCNFSPVSHFVSGTVHDFHCH